ncbi:hypothetical protein CcI49_18485 [Frankia sp. CcI49]|uniref:hypothetical protein n=1 Tax=Frankia sp. CcI49 TaxID=1745382 RepID=UPI00097695A4|nr:hypothetical protein [Frankia sp. CcI49]ONH59131.1 hypothetical protein CcI49_18485 [Frankia sp. CcI49]
MRWKSLGRRALAWLGSTRNTVGCVAALGGVTLGATGVLPAGLWPLATAALYIAGALAIPTRGRPQPPPEAHSTSETHPAPGALTTQEPFTTLEPFTTSELLTTSEPFTAEVHSAPETHTVPETHTATEAHTSPERNPTPEPNPSPAGPLGAGAPAHPAHLRVVLGERIAAMSGQAVPVEADLIYAVRVLADAVEAFLGLPEPDRRPSPHRTRASRTVERVVLDHLPRVLDEYLALPRLYATLGRRADGRTPHQAALDQVTLLSSAVRAITAAARSGDAHPGGLAGVVAAQERLLAGERSDPGHGSGPGHGSAPGPGSGSGSDSAPDGPVRPAG